MTKDAKALVKDAERRGYVLVSRSDRRLTYENPASGHQVHINPSTDERGAFVVRESLRKAAGEAAKLNKRNAQQIRARQERERRDAAAEIGRHQVRLAELIAAKEAALASLHTAGTAEQIVAYEYEIGVAESALRYLESLMKETPSSGRHRGTGQARHQAGAA